MQKKYIVRLSDEERDTLKEVVRKLKGTGQKVRRAQVLLNTTPLDSLAAIAAVPVVLRRNTLLDASRLRATSRRYPTARIAYDGPKNAVFQDTVLAV